MNSKETTGRLVVISAPSGTGKNSIINELLRRVPNATRLVTTTTRAMRPGEVEGVDYFFLDRNTFIHKVEQGDFVEHAEYVGNLYGMQKQHLYQALEQYDVVFANPEVQGKQALDRLEIPHIAIFLAPEDLDTLEERIVRRGGTDDQAVMERMTIAGEEMRQAKRYDKIIINREGKMMEAVEEILVFLDHKGVRINT